MPANDGLRLYHNERRAPCRPDFRQGYPEESVASAQAWPWALPAEQGQLLTQGQILQDELDAGEQEQAKEKKKKKKKKPDKYYKKDKFMWDEEKQRYICPAGEAMERVGRGLPQDWWTPS